MPASIKDIIAATALMFGLLIATAEVDESVPLLVEIIIKITVLAIAGAGLWFAGAFKE